MMDEMQRLADSKAGTPMGDFMNQIIAYMDVSSFVDQTMERKDARQIVGKMRERMRGEIASHSA